MTLPSHLPVSHRLFAFGLATTLALAGAATLDVPQAEAASPGASSPLRAHLALKQAALQQLEQQSTPPQQLKARVTAESRSGVRHLRIRDHQYLSDSDRSFAGYSLGAGSWDTEVGVLASAVADEFVIQAAKRGVPLDAVDVVFTSHPDDPATAQKQRVAYPRNLTYVAYLDSPASATQLEALRTAVEKESAVLNLIVEAQPIAHGEVVHTPSPETRDPQPPGLRDFLVEKRQAILRREAATKENPRSPYALRAHARVEPHTGLRNVRTGEGNFQLLHDSAANLVGYGLAPTVEEHQLGVLGTCLTHIFEIQAATRQVVLDSLEVQVEGTLTPRTGKDVSDPPRYRDVRYSVRVESPATREQIDQLRVAVEASCPVYNLLKDAQTVRGSVVRGAYTGS